MLNENLAFVDREHPVYIDFFVLETPFNKCLTNSLHGL